MIKIFLYAILISILFACSQKSKKEQYIQNINKIVLNNYKNYKLNEFEVKIGTSSNSYYKGDTVLIFIKGLPISNYIIKVDGRINATNLGEFSKCFQVIPNMFGVRKHTIQIFDLDDNLKLVDTIEFESKSKDGQDKNQIICDEYSCFGTYNGYEFVNGSDIAHQFSNKMSKAVGDQLKKLYNLKKYSKVEFSKIEMSTKGMGSGKVEYYLKIPFEKVNHKCESFTSFDHVGGWNHKPALENRKIELKKLLLTNESFSISQLKASKEGLQEYWIQWKNKIVQFDCGGIKN